MYDRILVGTDGSWAGTQAVTYAYELTTHVGATLEILYVKDTQLASVTGNQAEFEGLTETIANDVLDETTDSVLDGESTNAHSDVHTYTRQGVPYEELLEHTQEQAVDLLVLGTSGASESRFGSTTERVLARSPIPVLVTPVVADDEFHPGIETIDDIVVALDGSDPSERAATLALTTAERFGATIHAVYVVDTTVYHLQDVPRSIVGLLRRGGETAISDYLAEVDEVNVSSTKALLQGTPAEEILTYADGVGADLVTMGTRGQGGLPDRLLGSTTRRVVREATQPVLSVS